MYFIIGADLVPTTGNAALFINGDAESLVGKELKDVLDQASCRIFNLEVPLTDREKPIVKQGPNLIAPAAAVSGYKALGADILTLANNHIMDQDVQGLDATVETLRKADIRYLGTGADLCAAARPLVFPFADKKIGIYACAEHEFSVAEENRPGANPFDPLWSFDHVAELKKRADYVIVLYHGGKEYYRYPSPLLQKTCRRFADKGADLVLCQHSHCIGCEEKYRESTIVYGQGNFIFDDCDDEFWKTGLLVKVDDRFRVSYLPLIKKGNGVRLADAQGGKEILDGFRSRSEEIRTPGTIEKKYAEFADSYLEDYLYALSGRKTLFFRVLNKLTGGRMVKRHLRRIYETRSKAAIVNYIDCEAHRELLLQALKKQLV